MTTTNVDYGLWVGQMPQPPALSIHRGERNAHRCWRDCQRGFADRRYRRPHRGRARATNRLGPIPAEPTGIPTGRLSAVSLAGRQSAHRDKLAG
jgi:hypothetical protein